MLDLSVRKIEKALLSALLIALMLIPTHTVEAQSSVQSNQMKFGRLLRLIDGYYVDSTNVDELTKNAIVHLLTELDPHSTYTSKEEVEKLNEPLEGNFEGIGISFNIRKDTLIVLSTIAGGPSEKVGLRAGDRIVEVEDKLIAGIGLKNSDVFDMLRGKKGTKVNLKVLRKMEKELLEFTITRDKIPVFSLDASYMLDDATGYIKLSRFSKTTTEEFLKAMFNLKKEGASNLVLDLRGNVGGYLHVSVQIADQFLKDNKLVVYTEGRNESKKEYKATSRGSFEEGNLVVLIDEGSASASEIVSGAIQDWDRGIVIGRRSFGKGLVQKPFFLTDGSLVRLTIAHYYTPSGRCIQKPYDNGVKEYHNDVYNRMANGEMFSMDSVDFDDSLKYKTLVNGRTVFGGGGVMPDIFVPVDTSHHYAYVNSLRRKAIIYNYVLDYVDGNRNKLKEKYNDFDTYNKSFEVSAEMIDDVIARGVKEGIEKNEESLNHTLEGMKKEIKGRIAGGLFSDNEFYKILYSDDDAIIKALEIIKNQEMYNNQLVSTE